MSFIASTVAAIGRVLVEVVWPAVKTALLEFITRILSSEANRDAMANRVGQGVALLDRGAPLPHTPLGKRSSALVHTFADLDRQRQFRYEQQRTVAAAHPALVRRGDVSNV